MATASNSDDAQRTVFQLNPDDDVADPDVYVTQTFQSQYDQQKAELGGDTYTILSSNGDDVASDVDWDTAHLTFDRDRGEWTVDADALDYLGHKLDLAGFTFEPRPPEERRRERPLFDLHDAAEEGMDIEVEYHQKNDNGTNTKAGEVIDVGFNSGWEDKPRIAFRRHDDDHYMYVQFTTDDKAALYTGQSKAPFVGGVEEVRLEGQP